MRDIEFRGKRREDCQWVFGNLVIGLNEGWASIIRKADADEGQPFAEQDVELETIGQYVGLKDNSKQKVFEDDILYDPTDADNGLYVVKFMDGEFVLVNDDIIYDIEQVDFLQIIGNTHDNKELLDNGGN